MKLLINIRSILVLRFFILISIFSTITNSQTFNTNNLENSLININPDPNGEPWIAGGITREQWTSSIAKVRELGPAPRNALGKTLAQPLPDKVDNSITTNFRPVFTQLGGACAQASSIGYVFTYEINFLRGVPGNTADNQYPYDFTYNFLNAGNENNGSLPDQAWALAKAVGIPNVTSYGGFGLGKFTQWVSGYPIYFNAMTNRISEDFIIKTSTADGVRQMKQWLYDHQKGDAQGGCLVMCYNASGEALATIKQGLPEAGKQIMYQFGADGGHAITIVGYNDSVRYDFNKDGKYTNSSATNVSTWEIGAYLIVNSWGKTFGDTGKTWIPYRLLADPNNGVWESTLYGMKTFSEKIYKPLLTYKITMTHSKRSSLKLQAGYANSATATAPATSATKTFSKAFNYSGGSYPLQGKNNNNPIEIGLDVSDFVTKLTGKEVSLFLIINSTGGTGTITSFSALDYTGGETPLEISCSRTNVDIPVGTTTLKITRTMQPLLTLTPNGGEQLERGRAVNITWFDKLSENVKIELVKGGVTVTTISASVLSNGIFEWAIPSDFPLGSDYKIRIKSVSDSSINDASDSNFTIREKTPLELISPNGGEYIEKGKAFPITWNTGETGDLVIDLYKDRMPETTIIAGVKAQGPFSWIPPIKIPSGNTYTIRLSSRANPTVVYDESKQFVTIVSPIITGPMTENFETFNPKDSLTFINSWEQSCDDELDWYVHKGATPSRAKVDAGGTGPTGDHTTGKGNYLYLESSVPNNPSKTGNFLSPMVDVSRLGDVVIGFWYHMLSKEGRMGHLYVDVFADGLWKDSVVHFTGDHGDTWHQKEIRLADVVPQIPRTSKVQVRFRGITATDYDGDIGIDDFSVKGTTVPINPLSITASSLRTQLRVKNGGISYSNANGRLSVILLNGRKALDIFVKGNGLIDIRRLPHGVYYIKIGNETAKILR